MSWVSLLQDIASVYQIFSDEVLGSGQFGIVYGGTHFYFHMMLTCLTDFQPYVYCMYMYVQCACYNVASICYQNP